MTRSLGIAWAALAAGLPLGAGAQNLDTAAFIRPLVADVRDLQASVSDMQAQTAGITVRETADSVVIAVASDVLFDFDSAALSGKAQGTLAEVADRLARTPRQPVRVVGHTDARGSAAYNRALSLKRAKSVAGFLAQNGIQASRLKPEGRGESDPVAPNEIDGADNPDGRARNRRVEFILPKS